MSEPLSFPMNPEEYSRYCRAWQFYLHMEERERHDFLTPFVSENLQRGITRWPEFWLEVELWFQDDVDVFVRAVEDARPKVEERRRVADENRRAIADSHFEAWRRTEHPNYLTF